MRKRDPVLVPRSSVAIADAIDLDRVPKVMEERWDELRKSSVDLAVQRAVYRALIFRESWKRAGQIEGVSHQTAWHAARRFGLERSKEDVTSGYRRIVTLVQDEIEHRLTENPEEIHTRDLALVSKSAGEQLQKAEEAETPGSYMSVLDALAKRLREGGTLKLEITGAPQTIDVTPAR